MWPKLRAILIPFLSNSSFSTIRALIFAQQKITSSKSRGFACISSFPFFSNNEKSDEKKTEVKENPYKNSKIEINTFQNKDSSWGYDVSIDGQKSIIQPNIPSLPGNRGFNTSDEAKKTGEFAAYKIHNNII